MKSFYSESNKEGAERKHRLVPKLLHMNLFHYLKNIEIGKY